MKITDNISTDPITKQHQMRAGDVFIKNGQPYMIVTYGDSVGSSRYLLNLRTGVIVSALEEGHLVQHLPDAELLLRGQSC